MVKSVRAFFPILRTRQILLGIISSLVVSACSGTTKKSGRSQKSPPRSVRSGGSKSPRCPAGMVLIPAGPFVMGSNKYPYERASPKHIVTLSSYCMDKTEVTNAQYKACVKAGACSRPFPDSRTRRPYYGDALYKNYPVVNVSLDNAWSYCKWEGKRVPTEAQWE